MADFAIRVLRYDPQLDEAPHYEYYPVDYYDGMRVWHAIDSVNLKQNAGIAWRLSCREFLCGICTVMANGKPTLACKAPVENGMVLEPLPYFPGIKDLVVDRDIAERRLMELRPWLLRDGDISETEMTLPQSDVLPVRDMSECLHCLACLGRSARWFGRALRSSPVRCTTWRWPARSSTHWTRRGGSPRRPAIVWT